MTVFQSLHNRLPSVLALFRVVLLPPIIFLFWSARPVQGFAIFLFAAATHFFESYLPQARSQIFDPLCDKIFCISLFTLLMVQGDCPSWFLGLLMTVALLQTSGYLFLRVPKANSRLSFSQLALGRKNFAVQVVWIGLLLAHALLQKQIIAPAWIRIFAEGAGYCLLAALQITLFYRYFVRFRSLILPDFRLLAAARS